MTMDNTKYFDSLLCELDGKHSDTMRQSLRAQSVILDELRSQPVTIVGGADEGVRLLSILESLNTHDVLIVDMDQAKVGQVAHAHHQIQPFCKSNVESRHVILATHRTFNAFNTCKEMHACSVNTFMHLQLLYPQTFKPHFFHENMLETLLDNVPALKVLQGKLADDLSVGVLASCLDYRLHGDPSVLAPYIDWELYLPTGIDLSRFASHYVDCGSFDGDSVALHINRYPDTVKGAYAFEPDPVTFARLSENMAHFDSVQCVNKGVGNSVTKLGFSANKERASLFSEAGELRIDITTLDNELAQFTPSMIKMNIEAFEPFALEGATQTIQRTLPLLAISLYHQPEHIFSLQRQVENIAPGRYQFYLRQHDGGLVETVLYAVPL